MGPGIEIFQRQALQLAVDLLTHIEYNLLGNVSHHILLDIAEQSAKQVQTAQNKQNFIHIIKINRSSRDTHQQPVSSFEQLGCCFTHDLRTENAEYSTGYGRYKHDKQLHLTGPQIRDQPAERAFEILGLLRRHSHAGAAVAWSEAAAAGRRLHLPILLTHAISSSDNCEDTISRYTSLFSISSR